MRLMKENYTTQMKKVKETKKLKFGTDLEKSFLDYENDFIENFVSNEQLLLINNIVDVLDYLDLGDPNNPPKDSTGFETWDGEKLISAREKLARYSEPLGDFIHYHASRCDFAYIWRKVAFAKDWLPVKTELANKIDKVTNPEVENNLIDKYAGEQYFSMFHRRRADYLIIKMESLDRMMRTIDHRLRELSRQNFLPQDPNFK